MLAGGVKVDDWHAFVDRNRNELARAIADSGGMSYLFQCLQLSSHLVQRRRMRLANVVVHHPRRQ
jgi:hypothetical protein